MEWQKQKYGAAYRLTVPLAKILAERQFSTLQQRIKSGHRQSGDDRRPSQSAGYSPTCGYHFRAVVTWGDCQNIFYGNSMRAVQLKALCHYRARLRSAAAASASIAANEVAEPWRRQPRLGHGYATHVAEIRTSGRLVAVERLGRLLIVHTGEFSERSIGGAEAVSTLVYSGRVDRRLQLHPAHWSMERVRDCGGRAYRWNVARGDVVAVSV